VQPLTIAKRPAIKRHPQPVKQVESALVEREPASAHSDKTENSTKTEDKSLIPAEDSPATKALDSPFLHKVKL